MALDQSLGIDIQCVRWLISLRWIAFIVTFVILLCDFLMVPLVKEEITLLPLTVCTFLILISNVIYHLFAERWTPRISIQIQIVIDLLILTVLIHYSGGAENPLFFIYIFHVIISSILLSQRETYIITSFICLLFVGLIFLEYFKYIPHFTLNLFPHESGHTYDIHASRYAPYAFSVSFVFLLTMFVTAYFASTMAEDLRKKNQKEKEMADQIIQATKLATLGELISYLAHEINNPISAIILKSKNLLSYNKEKQLPPEVLNSLQKIDQNSTRIAAIIKSLLDYARPVVDNKKLLSINEILNESLSLIDARLKNEPIKLELFIESMLPDVLGNRIELEQVIINLINNALDAMPEGGVLNIKGYYQMQDSGNSPRGEIFISVSDSGIGLKEEQMEKLFTPFYTTKGEMGAGLGLAICQTIIKRHGGEISVESQPGLGSTFSIKLPVHRE